MNVKEIDRIAAKEGNYSFGEVLRASRVKANLSQQELADRLHIVRTSIRNWEKGVTKPDLANLRELCEILNLSAAELIGVPDATGLSQHERTLVGKYRKLSRTSQKAVDHMVGSLLQEEQEEHDRQLAENYTLLESYDTPAAAGPGCLFSDEIVPEYCFVKKNRINNSADAVIGVSGRSMEPYYHDGDSVYIEYIDAARDGEDVICSTADGAVIKRYQGGKLYSLNADLPFGEKYEDDNVRILARVLGIVSQDDIPSEEDIPLLEELLADDVKAFEKAHAY